MTLELGFVPTGRVIGIQIQFRARFVFIFESDDFQLELFNFTLKFFNLDHIIDRDHLMTLSVLLMIFIRREIVNLGFHGRYFLSQTE